MSALPQDLVLYRQHQRRRQADDPTHLHRQSHTMDAFEGTFCIFHLPQPPGDAVGAPRGPAPPRPPGGHPHQPVPLCATRLDWLQGRECAAAATLGSGVGGPADAVTLPQRFERELRRFSWKESRKGSG